MMVQENGLLKIGGFEYACPFPKNNAPELQQKAEVVSIYSASEVILKISNGSQADVWAIGCLCAEFISGQLFNPWIIHRPKPHRGFMKKEHKKAYK
jgi:serine/threonine protein kinase